MARYLTLIPLILALALAAPVSAQDEELEKALGSLRTTLGDSESDADSADLLKEFLVDFPDTKHTSSVLNAIAYYQGDASDDHAGAVAFIEAHIAKLEERDHIRGSKVVLAGLYDAPEYKEQLKSIVAELNELGDLGFRDYTGLIFSAFGAEEWQLANDLVAPAKEHASLDAVKEEYPDDTEEKAEERSADRLLDLDVYEGWSLANAGHHDKALKLFASAGERTSLDYFNAPKGMLNVYWGKTLMMKGDSEAALEKLLPMALWTESETANEAVMDLFERGGGCGEDFDHYLYENRVKYARNIDQFAAVDYEGETHESKDLMGKVTLVTFWFPT